MRTNEMVTDELLDELYKNFRFYERLCKFNEMKPITFEQFVAKQLNVRKFKMKKLKESGFIVR